MTARRISVFDVALAEAGLDLPEGAERFVYVLNGEGRLVDAAGSSALAADTGRFCRGGGRLAGEGVAWVFEISPDRPRLAGPRASLVLSRPIPAAPDGPGLLRADRIEMRADTVTPRHRHRGPGIRRLLRGGILGEIGDSFERIDPGHAWFESGDDPVIGTNLHPGGSAFVRVMVLPAELLGGKTSFVATDAGEAAKPRLVQNRVFEERLVAL